MDNETTYDVDYFIKKFEAIPEYWWCTGQVTDNQGRHCAYGHCEDAYGSGVSLERLLALPTVINDDSSTRYRQPTPKTRILAALYDVKKSGMPLTSEQV